MPWIKKAIELDIRRFHIVYHPRKESVLEDIYSGPSSLEDIIKQSKDGMRAEDVAAIFTDKEEAIEYAEQLLFLQEGE